jgi:formimidoylglutamate deiminase
MASIFAREALLPEGWARDVRLGIGDDGLIASIVADTLPAADDHRAAILLPAPSNLHSHAFQRAMAGLTERRGHGRDSFWTWRALMYRFAAAITPEDVEAIAALVQMEMLEAGYAAVGEFHYLHHAPDGGGYADPAEMSVRIAAAAAATGIGLTHLPVLYAYGGAGGAPLSEGQRRFGSDLDRFLDLVAAAAGAIRSLPADARIGIAPHSLRATTPEVLAAAVAAFPDGPIHIHVAEQMQEVRDIEGWLGARPVAWLLANHAVDRRWCLIHATHMTGSETAGLARSGATAGLCPITEANLGDGVFPIEDFRAGGGRYGVGSDSNVLIALGEELRTLEYGQRLTHQARAVVCPEGASNGRTLYDDALAGGARALARDAGAIATGRLADLVALDGEALALDGRSGDAVLDAWIFAAGERLVADVWSAGRHVVSGGRHRAHAAIVARYRASLRRLVAA